MSLTFYCTEVLSTQCLLLYLSDDTKLEILHIIILSHSPTALSELAGRWTSFTAVSLTDMARKLRNVDHGLFDRKHVQIVGFV